MSISLVNVSKSYDKKVIISNLSYDFPDKGAVVITGPSGVGKTTLLRIISGIEKNFDGQVLYSDNTVISFSFQEHRLFPNLTAVENLTKILFNKPTQDDYIRACSMLYRLGLSSSDINLYPRELSGGMKQRVSLARAFLHDADVVLLDEPTKELDPALVKTVTEIISELSEDKLLIIVSHDTDFVASLNSKVITLDYAK